jgi:hypothetical protein
MPLDDGQVQLRDLVMGPGTPFRFVSHFNPFSRNVRADQAGGRAWGDGGWSGAEWAEQVTIPMRLVVMGVGAAGWMACMQQLLAAFAPSSTDLDLRFAVAGTEYLMRGRPRMVDPEARHVDGHTYTAAAFVALGPSIYSGNEHQVVLGLPSTSGGLIVPDPTGPALNANPYFETDASNWSGLGSTVVRSTAQAHEGVASLLFTPDGVTVTTDARSENVPATVGTSYRASAWVWCAVSRNISININWRNSVGGLVATSSSVVAVTASTWTLLDYTAPPAPPLTTQAQVTVSMGATPPASNQVWIDEARIRQTGGMLTLPLTIPAQVTSGRATISNAGTKPVGLRLRVDGPVPEPRISLLTAAGTSVLRLYLTLTAGQWLDIDTAARTVYLNGTASRRGQAAGGWPVLPPGTGELAFDAAAYDPAPRLTTTWSDAWH